MWGVRGGREYPPLTHIQYNQMHAGFSFSYTSISVLLKQPLSIKKSYAGAIHQQYLLSLSQEGSKYITFYNSHDTKIYTDRIQIRIDTKHSNSFCQCIKSSAFKYRYTIPYDFPKMFNTKGDGLPYEITWNNSNIHKFFFRLLLSSSEAFRNADSKLSNLW